MERIRHGLYSAGGAMLVVLGQALLLGIVQ